jgi:myo-inositol catabolism protein IolS
MRYRAFGKTGLSVSEVGFGAWGIGGDYGLVAREAVFATLARAEELGCNFVDTASVYGDSEELLGEFLRGRRERWLVATKYSGQEGGLLAHAEGQLKQLGLETIDFYQIHWAPGPDEGLYEPLYRLKREGKARFVGVSLYSAQDIDYVLDHEQLDGIQIAVSLLDPEPYVSRLTRIAESGLGVIVRSCLKEGFLTGKFGPDATFPDPADQRHSWDREKIRRTVEAAERFRFLEEESGSMAAGAARYPLSFAVTSTVIMGAKSVGQAEQNFGFIPGGVLGEEALAQVREVQGELGLLG